MLSGCARRLLVRPIGRLLAIKPLELPALSPTQTEGRILKWEKQPGDKINEGDTVASVESDKQTMIWKWQDDSVFLGKIVENGHDKVPSGSVIGWVATTENEIEDAKKKEIPTAEGAGGGSAQPKKEQEQQKSEKKEEGGNEQPQQRQEKGSEKEDPKSKTVERVGGTQRVRASPAALSWFAANVKGTGPDGRIVEADVKKSFGAGGGAAGGSADFKDTAVSGMRSAIAKRLVESKTTAPHFYLTMDVEATKMKDLVNELNQKADGKYKISVNDFVVKASALACKRVPQVNSQWHGKVIRQFNRVDVNVAVATEAGLITPIVFNADLKGLKEISDDTKALAKQAKEGTLQPEQYQGGTFTISNLGAWGIKHFTAVINPPQSCILAVGCIQPTGVMSVTLSCDHRVVDGAVGATWLKEFREIVENPHLLYL